MLQAAAETDALKAVVSEGAGSRSVGGVDTEALNPEYFKAAGEPKTLWEIPESRHVGGLAARPAEYERRVIAFFDDALLP
jgi:hypothetical protein